MKLFIANCSKQEHTFTYNKPESGRPTMQLIRGGSQIKIEASEGELQAIIEQHAPYGLVELAKIKKNFSGHCYQFNDPVPLDAIQTGMDKRDQVMIDRGHEARKASAVVANNVIAEKAQEIGATQRGGIEVEITEERKGPTDDSVKFNETIQVAHEGTEPRPQQEQRA